jgi:hypothetical protein
MENSYVPPYTSPVENQNMTKYYEKVFGASDKWAEDRNKGDDEYWNGYIKSVKPDITSEEPTIQVKANGDNVNITISREEAMSIVQNYGSEALREVLRVFFVENKDVSDLDINLNERAVEIVGGTIPF